MPMHFSQKDQERMLNIAATLTGSTGWRRDARAFGAYADPEHTDLRAIAVFQNFVGEEAEFHFAMMPRHRLGLEVVRTLTRLAAHPRALNLSKVWAHIADSNIEAQVAALKCGFAFEYRKRAGFITGEDAIVLSVGFAPQAPATPLETTPEASG